MNKIPFLAALLAATFIFACNVKSDAQPQDSGNPATERNNAGTATLTLNTMPVPSARVAAGTGSDAIPADSCGVAGMESGADSIAATPRVRID